MRSQRSSGHSSPTLCCSILGRARAKAVAAQVVEAPGACTVRPESRRRLQSLEREQPHESTRTSELRPALPGCLGTCEVRLRGICRAHPSMSGDRGWFDDAAFGGPDSAMASSQACARRRAVWQRMAQPRKLRRASVQRPSGRTTVCRMYRHTSLLPTYLRATAFTQATSCVVATACWTW